MKRLLLSLNLLLFSGHLLFAQDKVFNVSPHSYKDPYAAIQDYIPYQADYMPIKRLRLVVHIFGKDDGSGNLQNTPKERLFLNLVIQHCQWFYKETEYMNPYPPEKKYTQIPDTRIRFVVDTFIFHRNTDDWNFRKYTALYDEWKKDTAFNEPAAHNRADYLYDKYVTHNTDLEPYQRDSALQIFLLECDGFSNRGMAEQLYSKKWVYILGSYYFYQRDSVKPDHWDPGMLLAHEIGHALGLNHPYDYGVCDDLPLTPKGATNNVMDCWPGQGRAFTPCQVGLIHWSLSGGKGRLKDIVIPDWRTYHPDSAIHIIKGDTVYWRGDRYLVGDLVLDRGAVFIVKSNVYLPPRGKLIIKPGARLIVDGGHITADKGLFWDGLKIEKGKRFLFFGTERKGSAEFLNKGSLQNISGG